jgi:hypothetical protein
MDIPWNSIPLDHHGIFRRLLTKNGSRVHYFYATSSGCSPRVETCWTEEIDDANDILSVKVTRSNVLRTSYDIASLNSATNPAEKKRKLDITNESKNGELSGRGSGSLETRPPSLPLVGVGDAVAPQFDLNVYWSSTEAKKLFRALDSETDALQAIENQMELLQSVLNDSKGYWNVITGLEADDNLTTHQKWSIHIKSQYLYCALQYAKLNMPLCQNWDECCKRAHDHLLMCGITEAGCSRCIRNLYSGFVTNNNRRFSVQLLTKHKLLPMFLDLNHPGAKQLYCKEHLCRSYQLNWLLNTFIIY